MVAVFSLDQTPPTKGPHTGRGSVSLSISGYVVLSENALCYYYCCCCSSSPSSAALKLHVKDRFTRHTLCSTRSALGIGYAVLCRHFIYDNRTGGSLSLSISLAMGWQNFCRQRHANEPYIGDNK